MKFVKFVVEKNKSVVSHHPSDISHLKKFVPFLSAECITLAPANNVRKDSGEIRTLAVGKARETLYEVKAGRFYEVKAGRLYEVKAIF